MNIKSVAQYINEYREELKDALKVGIVKDPALYWAGKMSQFIHIICNTPVITWEINPFALMDAVRKEYDNEIFSRIK